MKMDRKWIAWAVGTAALLALTACGPKQEPVTTPPPAEPTPAPTEVEPPPAPSPNRDMQEEPRPVDIETLQRELERSGVIGDVFFEFDSYELRAEARERIARNAEFLNGADGRELKVRLEGHCDERGTNEYNLALGQRRASVVADYLASLGVARSRVQVVSFGEEKPFCTESNEACWQKNRRSRFVLGR